MPKQINNPLNETKVPFTKMSYTPDVPSTALGANEYNFGANVETDVRGIRSVSGDKLILQNAIPGTPTYISGGFRQDEKFWTIAATDEGYWYASSGGAWQDITPVAGVGTYTQTQNITEAWNGTVPFFNDEQNPPMFWPEVTTANSTTIATATASSAAGTSTITFAAQPALTGVSITTATGQFNFTSGQNLQVNQKVIVSGTLTNGPFTLSGVAISGIAGQFTCTAASQTITVGQSLTISGTLGGTGTIVGYVNPTTYLVSATNGSTTFTLVNSSGSAIVTTAGTPTGLTYSIAGPSIVGYVDPTTYYIITTNGSTTFTLSATLGGGAITTTTGTPTGLTFNIVPFVVGQSIVVRDVVPLGFNGTFTVTGSTTTSVSYAGSTAGPQTVSGTVSDPLPRMTMYSNKVPLGISTITYVNNTTQQLRFDVTQSVAPFVAGETIVISAVNDYFNGEFVVVSCTTTTCNYTASPNAVYPGNSIGIVAPKYSWNYNPLWSSVYAKFMRLYNTPNVGSILVAGNLVATDTAGNKLYNPVTVQWSQNFGLNEAPITWTPTITNVANQLEVPLRGEAVDGFPSNGQFFLCSYWDTVVFSPINYSTTSAPILGVRLFNQGRGLLTSNCFVNTDKMIYGIDARDIWVFDGNQFTGLGNQRVKNWFYDQLDPNHVDQVHMEINSQKNQIEIYYTSTDYDVTTNPSGCPNKMLSYRYDLDCWNAPRDVTLATSACESPVRILNSNGLWDYNKGSRTVIYAQGSADKKVVEKDQGYAFLTSTANPNGDIASVFRRNNIKLLPNYSGKMMIHRMLPEVNNLADSELPVNPATQSSLVGSVTLKMEGANSVGAIPVSIVNTPTAEVTITTTTEYPWVQTKQNSYRVNNIEISNTSHENIWICTASTWQFIQTEDDR